MRCKSCFDIQFVKSKLPKNAAIMTDTENLISLVYSSSFDKPMRTKKEYITKTPFQYMKSKCVRYIIFLFL